LRIVIQTSRVLNIRKEGSNMSVVNLKGNVRNKVAGLGRTVSQAVSYVPDHSDRLETNVGQLATEPALMRSWYNW
jgi:hypothetical protein